MNTQMYNENQIKIHLCESHFVIRKYDKRKKKPKKRKNKHDDNYNITETY